VPEPGTTPALNAGIAAASGDVLALTDDDVLVADDWLAAIRRAFDEESLALVGGRVDPLWEAPTPSWLRLSTNGTFGQMASPLALLHYGNAQPLAGRTAVGANLVVRRHVHGALGGFVPHLGRRRGTLLCGEDHDFCMRAVAAGYRCEYRPEIRVRHHVPAARTTLGYYTRWFFWSGVTSALLEAEGTAHDHPASVAHFLRRLAGSTCRTVGHAVRGRRADAAAWLMDAAFAAGYVAQRLRSFRPKLWPQTAAARQT
jgi:GT2 family glycosyltransferase